MQRAAKGPAFHSGPLATHRNGPVSSNVRPHKMRTTRAHRLKSNSRSSFLCMDCQLDTGRAEHYYMLTNGIWRSICQKKKGMLCLHCAERRLNRSLCASDFSPVPVNMRQAQLCPELEIRLGRINLRVPKCSRQQPRQRLLRKCRRQRQ